MASVAPEGVVNNTSIDVEKAKAEHSCGWFINKVDPKFFEYDKPMILAVVVGGITLLLAVAVFLLQLATGLFEVTTESVAVTYPQMYGSLWIHQRFIQRITATAEAVESAGTSTEVSSTLCIKYIQVLVPEKDHDCHGDPDASCDTVSYYDKSMPFWSNVAGTLGVAFMESCWPGDEFMQGQSLNTNVEPAVWNGDPGTYQEIALCEPDTYTVGAQVPNSAGGMDSQERTGETDIKDLANLALGTSSNYLVEVTCPPVNNANGPVPWIVEYMQTTTTVSKIKPSAPEALGTAFAYSTYIQIFITTLIVNVMLLGNCLKHLGDSK